MSFARRAVAALALAVVGSGALAAVATTHAGAQDDSRARLHFQSGRSYFEEGAYEDALREFNQAFELSQRPAMLFNIGTTQERLAMYAEAATSFERYLAEVEDVPNRDVLARRITHLRARAAGDTASEPPPEDDEVDDGASNATDAPPPTAASGGGGGEGLVIGGAVSLGVAGLALVSFGVLGGLAVGEQSAVRDGCFASGSCTPADVSAMDSFALGADVSWPIALVAGGVGAVLVILGATSGGGESAALRVVPFAAPQLAGLHAQGSF